jgi:hypothetical protein
MELYNIPSPLNDTSISNDLSYCEELDFPDIPNNDGAEYKAVLSKVMKSPIGQVAVTEQSGVTSLNDQYKEEAVIKSLHDSLLKFSQKSPTPDKRQMEVKQLSHDSSNSSIEKRLDMKRLSQDSSTSSLDFKLPALKIPPPRSSRSGFDQGVSVYPSPPQISVKSPMDLAANVLYNNIGSANNVTYNNVSPNPNSQDAHSHHMNALQKAKSTHTLAVPSRNSFYSVSPVELNEKQKTVAAYFSGTKSPSLDRNQSSAALQHVKPVSFNLPAQTSVGSSSISRKTSMQMKKSTPERQISIGALSRSKTMPHIGGNLELLDESNVEDAFEELLGN